MHAQELAPRHREVACMLGTTAEHNGIEFIVQFFCRQVHAYMLVDAEVHAFGAQLLKTAIDMVFLKLEVGDAVAHQPADTVVLLK